MCPLLGHWLGLDVHDCGSYHADDGSSRLLEAGMVATVEPGLYISASDETVEARWRGLGPDGFVKMTTASPELPASVADEMAKAEAAIVDGAT